MNFGEALNAMQQGYKIKLKDSGVIYSLKNGKLIRTVESIDDFISLELDELLSDQWIVANPTIMSKTVPKTFPYNIKIDTTDGNRVLLCNEKHDKNGE